MFNANCYDAMGNTPLHIAARRGLLPVVRWLVEDRGAMITPLNHKNYTPIDMAFVCGHEDVVWYLHNRSRMLGRQFK